MTTLISKMFIHLKRLFAHSLMLVLKVRNIIMGVISPQNCYYAEFFTDKYIRRSFFPDFSYRGCIVEVGCATPELLSMSKHFRNAGWRCVGVEPNPRFAKMHRDKGYEIYEYAAADFSADNFQFTIVETESTYSETAISAQSYSSLKIKQNFRDYNSNAISHYKEKQISVAVRKLDQILAEHCPDIQSIDILSIDVEGYELEVLNGFDIKKYSPKVIVLENLFHDNEYMSYMQSAGYKLVKKIAYNYIYDPGV